MVKKIVAVTCIICVFIASMALHKAAHADLMITPTQILFKAREHYANVTLINDTDTPKTYKLELVGRKMEEGVGGYSATELSDSTFDLSKHIVFTPKRVTLPPKSPQKIRIGVRRSEDMAPGDYHVHLRFKVLPDEKKDDDSTRRPQKGSRATVSIAVNYAIPVILRVGESDVKTEIGEITLKRNKETGKLSALIPIERSPESSYSILGHLRVYHVDKDGNDEEFVGEIINANIFPEINSRTYEVLLNKNIEGGSLRIILGSWGEDDDFVRAERLFMLE